MPDAAGEIAYTAAVFPRSVSFATGWMMLLAYCIVCPWEAVAIGRIAGYLFPALNSFELYRVAGKPVFLPHLVIGLALTALLTVMNYRGIRLSASFQNCDDLWRDRADASDSLRPGSGTAPRRISSRYSAVRRRSRSCSCCRSFPIS